MRNNDLTDGYGVQWRYFDRKSNIISKQRFFKTKKARDKFTEKIKNRDDFYEFVAWCSPRDTE